MCEEKGIWQPLCSGPCVDSNGVMCSGNGFCNTTTMTCECQNIGWVGPLCNCSNDTCSKGNCDSLTGICKCDPDYYGNYCDIGKII